MPALFCSAAAASASSSVSPGMNRRTASFTNRRFVAWRWSHAFREPARRRLRIGFMSSFHQGDTAADDTRHYQSRAPPAAGPLERRRRGRAAHHAVVLPAALFEAVRDLEPAREVDPYRVLVVGIDVELVFTEAPRVERQLSLVHEDAPDAATTSAATHAHVHDLGRGRNGRRARRELLHGRAHEPDRAGEDEERRHVTWTR